MKLASCERVVEVGPILGADAIERVRVLGWDVVCKKGEFKVGDLVVYIQIDTVCPPTEQFEFLAKRDFRVRTIKLRGQISQGLIVPINPPFDGADCHFIEGEDITERLGIKKYSKPEFRENKNYEPVKVPKSTLGKLFHKFKYKYLYKLFPTLKPNYRLRRDFPTELVSKTDEERVQNIANKVFSQYIGKLFVGSEKADGSSITLIYSRKKVKNGTNVRVCSRNMELLTKDNEYFETMLTNKWPDIMKRLIKAFQTDNVIVQGEMIGKPCGNKYKLEKNDIRAFNIIVDGKRISQDRFYDVCLNYSVPSVPMVFNNIFRFENLEQLLQFAEGKSYFNKDVEREGVVFRCIEDNFSFKVISNKFLLKNEE